MTDVLRKTITDGGPFGHLEVICCECDEAIFTREDMKEGKALRNEAYLRYKVREHARNHLHTDFRLDVKPHTALKTIDDEITVGDRNR